MRERDGDDGIRLINIEAALNKLSERTRAVEVKMNIIAALSGMMGAGLITLLLHMLIK